MVPPHNEIEVPLDGVFRLELPSLQVDHDEAAHLQVVEQEVDVEVAIADFQVKLPADKGEALAEFRQEAFKLVKEIRLQLALVERLLQGEEVEDVRVLERLTGQVGLRSRQALDERPIGSWSHLETPSVKAGAMVSGGATKPIRAALAERVRNPTCFLAR